jgi:hypothetical protein
MKNSNKSMKRRILAMLLPLTASLSAAPVLDHQKLMQSQTFWDNRDFDWFEKNIPFLDTPDAELNKTYYYRWEVVTKHLTYGSQNTGYMWTEFINRPFWSGAYGGISCPAGLQFYETRWLRNPRFSRDYARYWFRTPGAQPRNYSAWMADSAWATHLVHPNKEFLVDLLPDLIKNFEGWYKKSWVADKNMFWQNGHDDGMEFNIASRQTKNILAGAPSYRPSFNAYMWADCMAISQAAELAGDQKTATDFRAKADDLKKQVQANLWDAKREFFFPMFRDDETDKDGNVVKKNTLVYETGKYAGSGKGRELASYVPWYFNMLDKGFESAWKFLMDPEYFYADYGPTTTERNDPQFLLAPGCCWWSGQSWPFATTQTLKALANVLQNYPQKHVSRADYYKLLRVYALSQRKKGEPYIAEALNPFTGSWDGHDGYYRSEHYFHSGFVDLIVTGLAGMKVENSDTLTVDPLAPAEWDYFAMENIPYRGHLVAIVWDKTGQRYGKGAGLQILVNGQKAGSSPTLSKLSVKLPAAKEEPMDSDNRVNHAVNNDGNYFPRLNASHVGQKSSLAFLQDGNTAWYHLNPPLRWTCAESPNEIDWLTVDMGTQRSVNEVKLFLLDDGEGQPIAAPSSYRLEYSNGNDPWKPIPGQVLSPEKPTGRLPNIVRFPEMKIEKLRVMFKNAPGKKCGMTEIEVWGPDVRPYTPANPPAGNLAFNANPKQGFPKATASHSDKFGGTPDKAIDGKIIYRPVPMNRWTSFESPNTSDWLEVDFGQKKKVGRVLLHIFSDGGGVRPPKSYVIEGWTGTEWKAVPNQVYDPVKPTGSMINTTTFPAISTDKIRVMFNHHGEGNSRSGISEIEIWEQ